MAMMAYTDDSSPDEMPDSTVVAGPVRAASAISRTGAFSVDVKYSVRRLTTWASTRPMTTAAKTPPARSCDHAATALVVADVAEGDGQRADDGEDARGRGSRG